MRPGYLSYVWCFWPPLRRLKDWLQGYLDISGMELFEGLFIQMLHQDWEDLMTWATYAWLFCMSWLPPSMAASGGQVSCETPGTSVSVNKAELIGFYEFMVSHLLCFVVYKQVTRWPSFKGRRIWLHLLMREWQGNGRPLQPSLKNTVCHNQQDSERQKPVFTDIV